LEKKKGNSIIYNAIIKYGIQNFNLEILEYCELDSLIKREQLYLDLLNPKYNICKVANSCLGVKRSLETADKWRKTRADNYSK
jgi:group I intron endonuclease